MFLCCLCISCLYCLPGAHTFVCGACTTTMTILPGSHLTCGEVLGIQWSQFAKSALYHWTILILEDSSLEHITWNKIKNLKTLKYITLIPLKDKLTYFTFYWSLLIPSKFVPPIKLKEVTFIQFLYWGSEQGF